MSYYNPMTDKTYRNRLQSIFNNDLLSESFINRTNQSILEWEQELSLEFSLPLHKIDKYFDEYHEEFKNADGKVHVPMMRTYIELKERVAE